MRAIVNKILKYNDEKTMGACEVTINDGNMSCMLNISNDEDIRNPGVPIDIELCLYSEHFKVVDDNEQKESISSYATDDEMETYCVVMGKIKDFDTLEDQLFLYIECLGQELTVVCYNKDNVSVRKGDYVSALCWVELIEND